MSAAHRGSPEHHLVLPAAGSHVLAPGDPCTGIAVRSQWRLPLQFTAAAGSCARTRAHRNCARSRATASDQHGLGTHTSTRIVGAASFALAPVPGVQTPELVYRAFGAAGIAGRFLSNCWLTFNMNSESFLEIPQRGTGEGVCATAPRGSRSAACHATPANGQHLPVAGRVLTPCTRVCDCAVRMGTEESQTKEQGQRAAELRRAKRGRRDLRMASCQSTSTSGSDDEDAGTRLS